MRGFFLRKIIPAPENLCRCKALASTGVQPAQGVTNDEIEVQALLELGEVGGAVIIGWNCNGPFLKGRS